jgi:regulator of sigma E protease
LVFVVFSLLIIVHEAGHLIAAKRAGITVEAFSLGMGRRLFGIRVGETDYRISMVPFGGFCKMAGEDPTEATGGENEFHSKPAGYRFWVVVAGSLANYILAFFLFTAIFMIGAPTLSNEVGQVLNGYPAEEVGIMPGDQIVMINDKKIEYWADILLAVKEESEKTGVLRIEAVRGGETIYFDVNPKISQVTNIFGQTITTPMLGIGNREKIVKVSYGFFRAVYYGGMRLFELTGMTYKFLWLALTGGVDAKASAAGPIGIAHFIKQAADLGIVPLLLITANVSMALAIFNLLPFPILDGGHVLFLALEKIRKRPLSLKVQGVITQVAFVILLAFALLVSWQDMMRFTPVGKAKMFNRADVDK